MSDLKTREHHLDFLTQLATFLAGAPQIGFLLDGEGNGKMVEGLLRHMKNAGESIHATVADLRELDHGRSITDPPMIASNGDGTLETLIENLMTIRSIYGNLPLAVFDDEGSTDDEYVKADPTFNVMAFVVRQNGRLNIRMRSDEKFKHLVISL